MKRQKMKKQPISRKIVGRFDIPEDIVFDVPRVTVMDNTEVRIENYKTVLEYDETKVQLACKKKCITVSGTSLAIHVITDDEVSIHGEISAISFS